MQRWLTIGALMLGASIGVSAQNRMTPPKVTTLTGLSGNQGDFVNLVGTGDYLCVAATCTTASDWKIVSTGTASGVYVLGVAAGYKVARGETPLDGTNPTPIASGLTTIVACSVSIKSTAAPGVSTSVVTYSTSTSTLNLYGWKVTGTGDTTLIASEGTDTIGWICVGT